MKTIVASDDANDPSWLRDEPITSGGNPFQISSASMGINSGNGNTDSSEVPLRRERRRRRRSYEDSDDDNLEDCCCCPQDPCLIAFALFHLIAGLLGVAAIGANAYHITQPTEGNRIFDIIQRCYIIVFSGIIILTETDWKFLMRRLKLLDLWVFRGFFYAFVGLNTLDLYSPTVETPECIVGLSLLACGVMYIIMGALCLKSVAARRKNANYKEIVDPEPAVYESV